MADKPEMRPRASTEVETSKMSSQEVEEWRDAFEVRVFTLLCKKALLFFNYIQDFDKNQNGRISMAELGEMMTNLGRSVPTTRELEDVLEELDVDKSGGVDFGEFLQFVTR